MKSNKINKAPEAEMIGKVRGMMDYLYPGIEEKTREIYVHENEDVIKVIKRKVDFRLGFHSWFLLKYEFPNEATAMEMADSFPMDFFTKDEKKMIKNFLNYKESLFKIIKISNDKRDYTIKDMLTSKLYLVKTLDMPAKFKEKDLIKTTIIKNLENDYFFYGGVKSFKVSDKEEFIKEMLEIVKIENIIQKERKEGFIEWKFDKMEVSR